MVSESEQSRGGEPDGSDTDGLCADLRRRIHSAEPVEQICDDMYYAILAEREFGKETTMSHQNISTNNSPSRQLFPPFWRVFVNLVITK